MKSTNNADHISTFCSDRMNPDSRRMLRRILIALTVATVCYVVPLWGDLGLLLDARMLFIVGACLILLLTQPEITLKEARKTARSDRYSVLLILSSAVICQIIVVFEWRFFGQDASPGTVMASGIVGSVLLVAGIVFRVVAIRILSGSFTATVQVKQDQQLITSGPYKYLRHPSYLGAYTAYIGSALLLNAYLSAAAVAVVMFYVYRFRMAVEEAELTRSFGDAYLHYSFSTKRMIPYVY